MNERSLSAVSERTPPRASVLTLSRRDQTMTKKAQFTVPQHVGQELYAKLADLAENSPSRHVLIQDEQRGKLGVLVDRDELNLLIKASDLLRDPATLAELNGDDNDEDGLTLDEVFSGSA